MCRIDTERCAAFNFNDRKRQGQGWRSVRHFCVIGLPVRATGACRKRIVFSNKIINWADWESGPDRDPRHYSPG